jgi:hypothetical protein
VERVSQVPLASAPQEKLAQPDLRDLRMVAQDPRAIPVLGCKVTRASLVLQG